MLASTKTTVPAGYTISFDDVISTANNMLQYHTLLAARKGVRKPEIRSVDPDVPAAAHAAALVRSHNFKMHVFCVFISE